MDEGQSQHRVLLTVSVTLATVLQAVDTTIANVALPHIGGNLSASRDQMDWVLTSYILAAAIMTPLSGWLAGRYGRYYFLGRKFVKAIGHPSVMRAFTDYGVPRERFMRFVFRALGNLTDGREGDVQDKILYAIERLAPAS